MDLVYKSFVFCYLKVTNNKKIFKKIPKEILPTYPFISHGHFYKKYLKNIISNQILTYKNN